MRSTRNGSIIGWTATLPERGRDIDGVGEPLIMVRPSTLADGLRGPSGTETTYYATPMFERVDTSAGSDFRHYLYAGNRPVVVISRTSAGVITTRSLLVDHQAAISSIVADATGTSYINEEL